MYLCIFFFFLYRGYFKPTSLLPLGVPFQLSLQDSCFPANDFWHYLLGDQVFAAAGHMFKLHQQLHPSCITSPSLYNLFFHTWLQCLSISSFLGSGQVESTGASCWIIRHSGVLYKNLYQHTWRTSLCSSDGIGFLKKAWQQLSGAYKQPSHRYCNNCWVFQQANLFGICFNAPALLGRFHCWLSKEH